MKHILIALLMVFSTASICASNYNINGISNGTVWNNGSLDYTAEVKADSSIIFTGCTEGQDLAFLFTPKTGKKDEYLITDGDPYAVNPFSSSSKAKYLCKEGHSLICLYDNEARLLDVLSPLEYPSGEIQAEKKWTRQLMGEYASIYDEPLTIDDNGTMRFSRIDLKYRHITFNGMITGVIEISGGSRLDGIWEVEITRDGLIFSKGEIDEYEKFQPTGGKEVFSWTRKDIPRFDYASKILFNDGQYRRLDKSLLRLIRNEIWFHHGYVPVSEDLREYLAGKEWYTPRPSNDGTLEELSIIELLNIEMIKATETLKEIYAKNIEDLTQVVVNVYDYIDDVRSYYLNTPPDRVVQGKWKPVDELFATSNWRKLRAQVDAIDQECGGGGFFDFGGNGPLDAWTYDCFEGKVSPQNFTIYLWNDSTAEVNFEIKDATTINPIPLCWEMRKQNGEWRVDDISFRKDDYFDLKDAMAEYVRNYQNGKGNRARRIQPTSGSAPTAIGNQDAFDFDRYHQAMLELAEQNLNYMKTMDDIRLISYALIDIDNDGIYEVWVQGDEGQDYEGVYAITPEGEVILLNNSDTNTRLQFYPGAVGSFGYFSGQAMNNIQTVKNSHPADYGESYVLVDNSVEGETKVLEETCSINGKVVPSTEYWAFVEQEGEPYQPDVQWHPVKPLHASANR